MENAVADHGGVSDVGPSGQSSERLDRLKFLTSADATPILAQLVLA